MNDYLDIRARILYEVEKLLISKLEIFQYKLPIRTSAISCIYNQLIIYIFTQGSKILNILGGGSFYCRGLTVTELINSVKKMKFFKK